MNELTAVLSPNTSESSARRSSRRMLKNYGTNNDKEREIRSDG